MNVLEIKMFNILKKLKENFGVVGVKAEFEAEGTRIDELLRLVEITRKLDLKLGIKIGGCEAMKDLMECKQFGTDYIIAPMVETEYALKKFIDAKNKIYNLEERENTTFLINIETKTTVENIDKIILLNNHENSKNKIDGWVFGRVDYSMSCGMKRNEINENESILETILNISRKANENNLELVVGGGISIDSVSGLKKIKEVKLDRFETRKIIFSSDSIKVKNIEEGMLEAINFELNWLKNKKNYYQSIYTEDDKRIKMLSERWLVNK